MSGGVKPHSPKPKTARQNVSRSVTQVKTTRRSATQGPSTRQARTRNDPAALGRKAAKDIIDKAFGGSKPVSKGRKGPEVIKMPPMIVNVPRPAPKGPSTRPTRSRTGPASKPR